MTTFIGDVHGKYRRYKKIIKNHKDTIQVGDMGVGFYNQRLWRDFQRKKMSSNPPYDRMVEANARFIRGNHDNPFVCKTHSQCIPDGHVEGDMMFMGGALSIDRALRVEGISYWEEEELSYRELLDIQAKYLDVKPKIMVTHDCPETVAGHLFSSMILEPSRTRQALDLMWNMYKPEVWIFGHWHMRRDQVLIGTRFICLEELGTIDL